MRATDEQILEAMEIVSAWDIPEEDFAQMVNDQVRLMAGVPPDEPWPETH